MSFTAFTARAREFVTGTLVDTCEVRRGGGQNVYDPATQSYVTTPGTLIWSGPCRIRAGGAQPGTPEVGEQLITLQSYRATLPLTATGIEVDDRLTVTASRDQNLLLIPFRVVDPQGSTDAKFRRVLIEADMG